MLIAWDSRDIRQLEQNLGRMLGSAMPYAVRNTLNTMAFNGRRYWAANMEKSFILRNHWTKASTRVERVPGGQSIMSMKSRLGSVEEYVKQQELGHARRSEGKHGYPWATPFASGEATQPRQRIVRKAKRLAQLNIHRSKGHTRAATMKAIHEAKAKSPANRYVLIRRGAIVGIHHVGGGKKNPKLKKVYDLSRRTIRPKQAKTLEPASRRAWADGRDIYAKSLRWQLAKMKKR